MSAVERDAERIRGLVLDIALALRERTKFMALVFVIAAILFGVALFPRQRYFEATALIQVAGDTVGDALTNLRPTVIGPQAALTEARALRSSDTMRGVIARAGLLDRSDFLDPGPSLPEALLAASGLHDVAEGEAARVATVHEEIRERAALSGRADAEVAEAVAVAKLMEAVSASPSGQSNVLEVKGRARSPELAALIANEVGRTYVAQQRARNQARFGLAQDWFTDQIDVARRDILTIERRIQDALVARTRSGVTADAVRGVVGKLNEEIAVVETAMLRDRDRAERVRTAINAPDATTLQASRRIADAPFVSDYAARLSRAAEDVYLTEERAGRDSRAAQDARRRFDGEMTVLRRLMAAFLASEEEALANREAYLTTLRASVARQTAILAEVETASGEANALEAELRLARERLDALSARANDFGSAAELVAGQSEIVGEALMPLEPGGIGLKVRMGAAVALAIGLALSAGLAAALVDGRFRKPSHLAAALGARPGPLLAVMGRRGEASTRHRLGTFVNDLAADGCRTVVLLFVGERSATRAADIAFRLAAAMAGRVPGGEVVVGVGRGDAELRRALVAMRGDDRRVPPGVRIDAAETPAILGSTAAILCLRAEVDDDGVGAIILSAPMVVVAAPWGRVGRADLLIRPELGSPGRGDALRALVYDAPGFAAAHVG